MSTIKITYTEQDEAQVKKAFDVLMVWYSNDTSAVLAAMKNNPIAVANQELWSSELDQKVQVYKDFTTGETLQVGTIRRYDGKLYACIQGHTTQGDWLPSSVPALFKRAFFKEEAIPAWVQPIGASDAYNVGDKVSFEGVNYESLIDANVWSPSAYPSGWKII